MDPDEAPQQPSPQLEAPVTNPEPPSDQSDPAEAILPVPESWPGAFGVFKFSKKAVMINVWLIIGWGLLGLIVNGAMQLVLKRAGELLGLLAGSLFNVILAYLYISSVRGKKVKSGEAFSLGLKLWLKAIVLNILVDLSLLISFLLLIVPFFFVAPRLSLATYFLVDKNMGVLDAYKASWNYTKDNSLKVWGVIAVSFLFAVLCLVLVGIYLLIMYSAAFALVYEFILRQQPVAQSSALPDTSTATTSAS